MLNITRKRSVVTLALVTGLLAAAAPAHAGIAIGNPPGTAAGTVTAAREAGTGLATGVHAGQERGALLDADFEI